MLKDEYKKLRAAENRAQQHAYRYTVRQLESLIRLSEAMARVHADGVIRPSYVREVCRLLKTSNIILQKNDIEFDEIQDDLNQEQETRRQMGDANDLFVSKNYCVDIDSVGNGRAKARGRDQLKVAIA